MEEYGPRGGIGGEGVRNLLAAPGFAGPEDVVARESIQNSVDARRDGGKVRVVFRRRILSGKAKETFFKQLQLREALCPRLDAIAQNGGNDEEERARTALSDSEAPIELLYIEDFNTIGLGGGLTDPNAGHFYRLLFLVGDGDKGTTNTGTGGSYGYGKSVYASTSSLFTILTYSRFVATKETGHTTSRLLASTFLRKHRMRGKDFTGRGWFGMRGAKRDDPAPIVDDKADSLAASLGFARRDVNDTGTSMLILGASLGAAGVDLNRLRKAIETWWWPRLIDDGIDVELFDGDTKLPGPRPRARDDLKHFIQCYAAISHDDTSGPLIKTFNAVGGTELGSFGVMKLEVAEGDQEAAEADEEESEINKPGAARVALIRSPKMVVTYASLGSQRMPPAVGVFVADEDETTDKILKLSEPPQHDKWDPHAQRLERIHNGSLVVESVLKRCKKEMRAFQKQLAPPKPKPKERLRWFDKILGQAFASTGKGTGTVPKGEQGDVRIHFPHLGTIEESGGLKVSSDLVLQLKDRFESERARVRVTPTLHILEGPDAHKDKTETLALTAARDDDGSMIEMQPGGWFELDLSKDEPTQIHLVSSRYDPEWSVELTVSAEPVTPLEA